MFPGQAYSSQMLSGNQYVQQPVPLMFPGQAYSQPVPLMFPGQVYAPPAPGFPGQAYSQSVPVFPGQVSTQQNDCQRTVPTQYKRIDGRNHKGFQRREFEKQETKDTIHKVVDQLEEDKKNADE